MYDAFLNSSLFFAGAICQVIANNSTGEELEEDWDFCMSNQNHLIDRFTIHIDAVRLISLTPVDAALVYLCDNYSD